MRQRKLRLLIVDDLENWRHSLRLQFNERSDIVLSEAASGEEAIKKIAADDYDLVLLDMKMPTDAEGLNALERIRLLKPNTEVIMMSAYGDIPKAVKAVQIGARDFVPKEMDFEVVIEFKVNEFIRTTHLIHDRELLIGSLYSKVQNAKSAHEKGKALEDLISSLLASIDGFIEIFRDANTATEEIDLVIRNSSRDPEWQKESDIILVECKNWKTQRVGKNELVSFEKKIENRSERCTLGFLVSTGKISGTVEKELLRSSRSEILVVPIDGEKLSQLVQSRHRSQLLRQFVDRTLLL
jgi:DNA-binding NarL/FixJ family response regulator